MSSRLHGYLKSSSVALLIAIMLVMVFLINLQRRSLDRLKSPSFPARCWSKKALLASSNSVSVYMTYVGLTSCTVLPCWGLGLGEGREDGEEMGDGEGRGLEEDKEEGNGCWGRGGGWVGLNSLLPGLCSSDS